MNLTDVVWPDKAREYARTFDSNMVVEYLHLDISTQYAVVAVTDGIDDQLFPEHKWLVEMWSGDAFKTIEVKQVIDLE